MDGKTATWAAEQVSKKHDRPFFLAFGIVKPHEPWYVPRKYFEMHPLDRIILPPMREGDLDDVPEEGRRWAHNNNHYPVAKKSNPAYRSEIARLQAWLPKHDEPEAPRAGASRPKAQPSAGTRS